jgi:hypothetical protein
MVRILQGQWNSVFVSAFNRCTSKTLPLDQGRARWHGPGSSVFTELLIFRCIDEIETPSAGGNGGFAKMWMADLESAVRAVRFRNTSVELAEGEALTAVV